MDSPRQRCYSKGPSLSVVSDNEMMNCLFLLFCSLVSKEMSVAGCE